MNTPVGRSLREPPSPLAGGDACGLAEPVPRRPLAANRARLMRCAQESQT